MREIEVNTDTLQQQLTQFRDEAEQLKQVIGKLSQTVEELNPMWEGPSHTAFYQQYVADHEEFEDFLKMLMKIENHFEEANNKYNICEAEVGSIVDSIIA